MDRTILLIFSLIIEAIILYQYAGSLFTPMRSSRIHIAVLCVLYFVLFCLSLFQIMSLNIVFYFIFNLLFLITQFRLPFRSCLFHSAMLTVFMSLSELLVFWIISYFTPEFVTTEGTGLVLFTVFSKTLFFATIYLLSHLFQSFRSNSDCPDRSGILLMLIPLFSIFVILTFFFIGEKFTFIAPLNIMVTVSSILLLFINLLIFGINQYTQKKNEDFTEMQLLLQKESDSVEYYEMLLSQTENQNILIHDLKKHLQSIELLNEKHDSEKIRAYIHQLLDSSDLKETSRICDNEILNAILCRYQRQCNEKRIHFISDIRSGVLQDMQHYNLTALFCNLLDNAIEAAEMVPDSYIELTVQKKEQLPFIVIVVINSCRCAPTYDSNHLPISHKSNHSKHGYGMKSIKKVVKQFHGDIQMYYDDLSATFHTIITLKTG